MKVMAIVGSCRSGNSLIMVNYLLDVFKNSGIDFEIIHLKDISFGFCNGCLQCDETGECYQNDELNEIVKRINKADAFVLASPTRWSLLSGEMKVFLDRLNPLASKEQLLGKKAIIFSVGQTHREDDASVETAANSIKAFCENAGIEVIDIVLAYGCLAADDVRNNTNVMQNCILAAQKLIKSIN